jgi:hypothetical protein
MKLKLGLLCAAAILACSTKPEKTEAPSTAPKDKLEALRYDKVSRAEFNQLAPNLAEPLFWAQDANNDGALDPEELAVLWGIVPATRANYVQNGAFTQQFKDAYAAIAKAKGEAEPSGGADDAERQRRQAVLKELSQGRQTLVASNFEAGSGDDKGIVLHVLNAAQIAEQIHLLQRGATPFAAQLPGDDPASRMAFYRNQGPWCVAPQTENDPNCSAVPSKPTKISGLYPESLQKDQNFCETLQKRPDHEALLGHFSVVKEENGKLVAVPYNVAYKGEMEAISAELTSAAASITSDKEAAFKAYLVAASKAFLDNNWVPADEAWAKMSVTNSKWYLRIGPDEVYDEPCNTKAQFHTSFGLINQGSLKWQEKLDPLKKEMEETMAKLAGAPYKARAVSFHLPDFVEIVVNAGDSRSPHGATIGQSLPNFGPVANEGRGRTVALTNFYTDPDSVAAVRAQAESLFCADTIKFYNDDPEPLLLSTILHEAAHNLGPAHEHKVKGKTAEQTFGGPLASMLEELKAETAAFHFESWLQGKNLIEKDFEQRAHIRDLVWGFGHISRGMYTAKHEPKPYSQLAAIQLGFFRKEGAVTWQADGVAANGKDKGCLSVDLEKVPAATQKLLGVVAGIKARGDKPAAEALKKEFVDTDQDDLQKTIAERVLRAPKQSFVYSVRL